MELFLKRVEQILVKHNVDIENPFNNNLEHLLEVRENVISDYKENKLKKGEYIRTLFQKSQLMRKIHYL